MNPKHNYKAWFMEYPSLLFGKVLGVDVFNATKFLESLNIDTKQIDKFKTDKANVIEEYSKRLDMPVDQFFMQDDNGDVMIYCDLCFAFLYYVNPSAEMKMHDYMFLLHTRGMVMTDISLATMAKEQLSPTILKYMVDDIKKQES